MDWRLAAIPACRRDNASALPSDDTQERGFYRLVCIQAEARAFIAEYTIGQDTQIFRPPKAIFVPHRLSHRPQSSSASRRAASLAGFFILSQYGDRPET